MRRRTQALTYSQSLPPSRNWHFVWAPNPLTTSADPARSFGHTHLCKGTALLCVPPPSLPEDCSVKMLSCAHGWPWAKVRRGRSLHLALPASLRRSPTAAAGPSFSHPTVPPLETTLSDWHSSGPCSWLEKYQWVFLNRTFLRVRDLTPKCCQVGMMSLGRKNTAHLRKLRDTPRQS